MYRNEGSFSEYCTRFQDRSMEIRVLMCESAKDLIECQPSCLSVVVAMLKERLKDSQWEVRRSAVDSLCNVLNSHFESICEDVVYPLCERVLDKRSEVRKFAVTGLVNVRVLCVCDCRFCRSIAARTGTAVSTWRRV